MPKRSNAFQTTIYVINRVTAEESAIVTESHELIDLVSGKPREVDITVQLNHAGDPFIFGIECRDRDGEERRPQDVTFVDQIHGKHLFLPIDKTILVSATGFTQPALDKAKLLKMLAITPDELTEDATRKLLHVDEDLFLHETEYIVKSLGVELESCECHGHNKFLVPLESGLYFADGVLHKTLADHFREFVDLIGGPDKLFRGTANPHRMRITPVLASRDEGGALEPLYIGREGGLHGIKSLVVHAESTEIRAPMKLRYGVFKDVSFGAADVEIGDNKVTVITTVRDGEVENVTIRDNGKSPSGRRGARKR